MVVQIKHKLHIINDGLFYMIFPSALQAKSSIMDPECYRRCPMLFSSKFQKKSILQASLDILKKKKN